jgi:hypothetical protein
MRRRNLAHDQQPQPETASGVVSVAWRRTSLERVEDLAQSRRIDGRPAVCNFEPNIGFLAAKRDTNRRVGRAVLDRIQDEIADSA